MKLHKTQPFDTKVENDYDLEDDHGHREKDKKEEQEEELSVERIFENQEVASWRNELTLRAFVVSFVLSILFSVIVMKLNLTTGIIPSLNVSAGLLGFFFIKTWTKFLEKSGLLKQPFTRQENTVIQTCVVASSGIAFSGGFGSYLFGMSETVAKQLTEDSDAFKNPSLSWMIGFLFVVSFLGLFSVVPLRKVMIIGFKLTYPSGTATAHLINSFHTPAGAKLAKKQVRVLGKFFSFSFFWGFFQWFYTAGDGCGFAEFPSLGLKAHENKFFFDFSATYVGVGMICPYIINTSVLLGGILSWGLMWPLIDTKKGDWYPADLKPGSLHGLQGYKVFIATALILGDGLYNFFKVLSRTLAALFFQLRGRDATGALPIADRSSPMMSNVTPNSFSKIKFQHARAFCNAYGCGLTDWSLASTYGTLAIFVIGAWAGASHGGTFSILINLIKDALGKKRARFIPNPMAMAIPFYIGSYFAIDMCVGSLILFIWEKIDKAKADALGPAVASGCRHVYFEHIAIIVVDFFFLIRIRPSRITPKTAVVILGCSSTAFNSSAVVLQFDVITAFAPVCIIFGFYSIW
ncbi:hypothetical protein POTOM_055564 [Populus tomentosa]|uniref:YELLOW STRIPE like 7 n=1 Tax=Populus tomentosa TaxID=118781 RepID=A0A8X7Y1D0_POPTO|nr:hypothetical protein POTOM_055564 [Populus tomentosa]